MLSYRKVEASLHFLMTQSPIRGINRNKPSSSYSVWSLLSISFPILWQMVFSKRSVIFPILSCGHKGFFWIKCMIEILCLKNYNHILFEGLSNVEKTMFPSNITIFMIMLRQKEETKESLILIEKNKKEKLIKTSKRKLNFSIKRILLCTYWDFWEQKEAKFGYQYTIGF